MKRTIVLVLLCLSVALAEEEAYPTKWDKIDADAILANDRLRNGYVNCLLNVAPCTSEGNELKQRISDALQTDCSKCSEVQKETIKKVVKYLMEKDPEVWKKLVAMYDPEGTYTKKYEEKIKELAA